MRGGMGYLDRIAACNNADFTKFLPFLIGGERFGWIARAFLHSLAPWSDLFRVSDRTVTLDPGLAAPDDRTAALAEVGESLERQGVIHGWRGELYAVKNAWEAPPTLLAERALMPYFGFRSYGVHVNGYVRRPDGLYLWIARRSEDRPNFPGLLDNTVAGGQPHGLGLMENVIKECAEEAALPRAVARASRAAGHITYNEQPDSVRAKPDRLYCYDLEMPDGVVPRNTDGEIAAFFLMRAEEVMTLVRETDAFKPNCAMVLIDFFLRHGLLTPDDEPDHAAIVQALDRRD